MCSVYLKDSEKVVSISSEHLEPITPTKNNKVKVILGEDREATGVLLSIDGEDGIVRMDLDEQLKISTSASWGSSWKPEAGRAGGLRQVKSGPPSFPGPWL